MSRTPEHLTKVAALCHEIAETCRTSEARSAFLEVEEELRAEADELTLKDEAKKDPVLAKPVKSSD